FRIKYFFLSILSGLLIAMSFPKINAFYLAWIAFIPLIYCSLRNCVRNSLIYGFISGMVCYVFSLYWIFSVLQFNTDSFFQSIIASFFLWAYLSLYVSLWSGFVSFSRRHFHPVLSSIFSASCWVSLEFIRTYFLTGFGWNIIGYSQSSFTHIIQIADIFGVYGLSFIIIFINMLLYYWLLNSGHKRYLFLAVAVFCATIFYGSFRINKYFHTYGEQISIGVVQPNIDQYKKWNDSYVDYILRTLSGNAVFFKDQKIDLMVYPETALPGYLQNDLKLQNIVKNIASFSKLTLIGSPGFYNDLIYNSIFAVKQDGTILNAHNKNHLVVFGEYIPFRKLLAKYFGVLNSLGDFSKGEAMQIFRYNHLAVGATICSENFFPDLSRKLVVNGSKILTNHTNDAWFFDSFAPYQHFVMNIFRAVENRKNVIVSANTGISAVIDASGNVVTKTKVNENISFIGNAYQNEDMTIYDRFGDVFAYMCSLFALFIIILVFVL
ncbi:MAG: apolipoprotein N-acyltransferase, partial [Endomicrobiaceae bacterium]